MDSSYGLCLMRVKLINPFGAICGGELAPDPAWHWRPLCLPRGNSMERRNEFAVAVACGKLMDNGLDLTGHSAAYGERSGQRAPPSGRIIGESDAIMLRMGDARKCIVRFRDGAGAQHVAEITAESLYEAVR